jgi:hypothetical protein
MTENQYQKVILDMRMMSKRIGTIEEKCGCKVKWKDLIEKQIGVLKDHSHAHAKQEGISFPYNPDYGHNDPDCPFCDEPTHAVRDIVFGYVNQLAPHEIDEAKLGPRINDIIAECELLAAEIDEGKFDA